MGSTGWQLQNSQEDVKYSMGNRVNDIVITVWGQVGTGNPLDIGDHFVKCMMV